MLNNPNHASIFAEEKLRLYNQEEDYQIFVSRIYNELACISKKLESGRMYFMADSEDKITYHIITSLECKGIQVTHGEFQNGSTDIKITHGNHKLIGECKIWTSHSTIKDGREQLITRYQSGEKDCFMLLYNQKKNVKGRRDKLVDTFQKSKISLTLDKEDNYLMYEDDAKYPSGFSTKLTYRIIDLFFQPQDKSGKKAKKYQN